MTLIVTPSLCNPSEICCSELRVVCTSGEFLTEVQHTQGMKNTFERWFITAFQSLQVSSHIFLDIAFYRTKRILLAV